jgi:O-antigen/teichoic acid export membrane protein
MKQLVQKIFKSETDRDTSYLLGGTVISNVFGLIVITILARQLSPVGFGLFVTALTFAQLLADFSELGVNSGSMNFVAKASDEEKKRLIKNSLFLKIGLTGLIGIIVLILAYPISLLAFRNLAMLPFVQISAIACLLLAMISWTQTILQTESRFFISAIINASTNTFRFIAIGMLLLIGILNPVWSYFLFQIVLIFSIGIFFFKHDLGFLKFRLEKEKLKEIMTFGLPIGLSFSLGAIYTRLDQILVFNYLGSADAGVYGLASRLILVLIFIVTSFSSAIAPRYAHMSTKDFSLYFKKSIYASMGLVTMTLVCIGLAPIFIPLIFGAIYQPSAVTFQILALGTIFFIFSIPLNLFLIFRHQKNVFIFIVGVILLVLSWVLLNLLIPIYGIYGSALAVTLVNFVQLLAYIIYVFYLTRKNR